MYSVLFSQKYSCLALFTFGFPGNMPNVEDSAFKDEIFENVAMPSTGSFPAPPHCFLIQHYIGYDKTKN